MNLNTSISALWLFGVWVTTDALNQFSSKWMTLTSRGGLWNFSANLALCAPSVYFKIYLRILWSNSLLGKYLLNFVSLSLKFHNRYCHTLHDVSKIPTTLIRSLTCILHSWIPTSKILKQFLWQSQSYILKLSSSKSLYRSRAGRSLQ